MKIRQYLNYNFNTFFFIFCLVLLAVVFFTSCAQEIPPTEDSDDDFMEKYIQEAEEKFKKNRAYADSVEQGLITE